MDYGVTVINVANTLIAYLDHLWTLLVMWASVYAIVPKPVWTRRTMRWPSPPLQWTNHRDFCPQILQLLSVVSQRIGYIRVRSYLQRTHCYAAAPETIPDPLIEFVRWMLQETLSVWTLNFDWGKGTRTLWELPREVRPRRLEGQSVSFGSPILWSAVHLFCPGGPFLSSP